MADPFDAALAALLVPPPAILAELQAEQLADAKHEARRQVIGAVRRAVLQVAEQAYGLSRDEAVELAGEAARAAEIVYDAAVLVTSVGMRPR